MKKILVYIILLVPFSAWSQNNEIPEDLSVIIAPGLSHVFGGEKLDPSFAYLFGIEKNVVQFSEKSFMNIGLVFSMQGVEYSEIITEEVNSQSGKVSLGYLGIPIVYRHRSPGGLFWEAGLQTGFLLTGKDKPEGDEKSDYKESVKAVDIGIPVGLGYWFNSHFSIGARAVYGLTDMSGNGARISPANGNHQNFLLVAMLRYNITGK